MQKITLADCYGFAGLSHEAVNISLRIGPFEAIAAKLTNGQVLDAIRFYFGLPVDADTEWLSGPIMAADESFSMVTNERELAILSMALIAHEIREEESQFAALAFLTASSLGKRTPAVYPQFVEIVDAAAKDLMTSPRQSLDTTIIRAMTSSETLAAKEENLVGANDVGGLNRVLKELSSESHNMVKNLATKLNKAIKPVRAETLRLREETDMLWWLVGGESHLFQEPYLNMKQARAAFLIGSELAELSRTVLGPRASEFLMNKALREGRTENSEKVKIHSLLQLFKQAELARINPPNEIDKVRDLCSLNNAIARAYQVESKAGWQNMYDADGSFERKTAFAPKEIALQSFREARLLRALKR